MPKRPNLVFLITFSLLLSACSPRDFLTRRLAADLIAASETFRAPRQFQLVTGVIANKDYLSPDYLVLQHRGWISATTARCPAVLAPPPCWDITLTPLHHPRRAPRTGRDHWYRQAGQRCRRRIHLAMDSLKRSRRAPLPRRRAIPFHRNVSRLRRRLAPPRRLSSSRPAARRSPEKCRAHTVKVYPV